MRKKLQALLKNQKGFTLVELLAVIVILGIIGAIAVPSIAGIIDNSKKDAHIANAQQMVGAARMAIAAGDIVAPKKSASVTETLNNLETNGYLEPVSSPGTSSYDKTNSLVKVSKDASGVITYTVTLKNSATTAVTILNDKNPSTATRTDVTLD